MKKTIIILIAIAVAGGAFVIHSLNGLAGLDENVKAKWSQVLNQYQRRSELVPNLVATVKGYADHEQETLTEVVEARAKAAQVPSSPESLPDNAVAMRAFQANQSALTAALSKLMVVVEKYPDLKANENFLSLQSQLEGTENRIAVARKDYIDSVQQFNSKIRTIPTAWIAKAFTSLSVKETFNVPENKVAVPAVQF